LYSEQYQRKKPAESEAFWCYCC